MKITISVVTRAAVPKIIRLADGSYKAWLRSAPVDGKANEELVKLVSSEFTVTKSRITIVRGKTGKKKILELG